MGKRKKEHEPYWFTAKHIKSVLDNKVFFKRLMWGRPAGMDTEKEAEKIARRIREAGEK